MISTAGKSQEQVNAEARQALSKYLRLHAMLDALDETQDLFSEIPDVPDEMLP